MSGFANVAFSERKNTDAMRISSLRWKRMVLRKKNRKLESLGKSLNMGTLLIFAPHQSETLKDSISILKFSFVELRPVCHSVSMQRCLMAYFCSGVNLSVVRFDWCDSKLVLSLSLVIIKVSKDILIVYHTPRYLAFYHGTNLKDN